MTKNYIELIKNFTKKEYASLVNLHVHTCFSDGKLTPEVMIEQAKQKGLNFISITDHNTVDAYLNSDISAEEIVIPGIEFDCWHKGIYMHMLGYGIDIENENLKKFYAKNKRETQADWVRLFSKRSAKNVIKAIHDAGGIAVLAHPACCFTPSLDFLVGSLKKAGLDGLEVYYPYPRLRSILRFYTDSQVEKFAEKHNLIKTGGTDEHGNIL